MILVHQLLAILFWTAFWSVFRASHKVSKGDGYNLLYIGHYLRVIVPLSFLFLFLTLREILPFQSTRIMVGINFILASLIIIGRFQFVRFVVLGKKFTAYRFNFEYIPLAIGIFGYVFTQFLLFQHENISNGLIERAVQAYEMSQMIPELKFIYLLLINADLLLLIRQIEIVYGIEGKTKLKKLMNRLNGFFFISFFARFVSFIGAVISSPGLFRLGMLWTFVSLVIILLVLLFFSEADLPEVTKAAQENEDEQDNLWEVLLKYLDTTKPFLSKNLQMKDVALQLEVRESELRAVIQLNSGLNFPELINAYRLHHLIKMELPENQKPMTSEAMADACGFNSRTTLFRTTKKWLNMSASQIVRGEVTFNLESAIRKK